jgi:hypothetical protein
MPRPQQTVVHVKGEKTVRRIALYSVLLAAFIKAVSVLLEQMQCFLNGKTCVFLLQAINPDLPSKAQAFCEFYAETISFSSVRADDFVRIESVKMTSIRLSPLRRLPSD